MEALKKLRFFNIKLPIIIVNITINLKNKSTYFSIIVPCYNASSHIERCIKSIRKQTFKNFEVIFIDDCSSDKTLELLKKYQRLNSNFKIMRTPLNSGPGAARNIGLRNASGKYVCFLDSDDCWFSKKLEVMFYNTQKFKEEIFCHNELCFLNSKLLKRLNYFIKDQNYYEHLLMKGNQLSTSATVVKLNFINNKKIFFNENKSHFSVEDYDYWLKLTFFGAKIRFINKYLGIYNLHNLNISMEHKMHRNNVLNVIHDHSFNIQKISQKKHSVWTEASLRIYLSDIKVQIKNLSLDYQIIKNVLKYLIYSPLIFFKVLLFKFLGNYLK